MKIERLIQRYDIFDTKKLNENTVEYYSHVVTRLPKPFKDREMLSINRRREENDSVLILSFSVNHPNIPTNKKYVRMVNRRSDFLFRRIADNQTELTIITSLELKGNFPKWMMKMFSGSFVKTARNTRTYFTDLMKLKNSGVENPGSMIILKDAHGEIEIPDATIAALSSSLENSLQSLDEEDEETEKGLQNFLELNGLEVKQRKGRKKTHDDARRKNNDPAHRHKKKQVKE